jgi:hypothetical protein
LLTLRASPTSEVNVVLFVLTERTRDSGDWQQSLRSST